MTPRRLAAGLIGLVAFGVSGASAQEWNAVGPPGGAVTSIASDDHGGIYASNGQLLYRWNADANTWHLLRDAPGSGISISGSTLYRLGGPHAYRSDDAGLSWLSLGDLPEYLFDPIAVDAIRPSVFFAATLGDSYIRHLFRSDDGGVTWHQLSAGLPADDVSYHYILLVDSSRPNTVFLGSALYGVFRSTDEGDTWMPANGGLPCPGPLQDGFRRNCLSSLAQAPDGTLYVGIAYDGGLYRSEDRGDTWQLVAPELTALEVDHLAVDASGGDTVLAVAITPPPRQNDGTFVPPRPRVYRSDDRGQSFVLVHDGLPVDALGQFARPAIATVIDPTAPHAFYAATERGVYRSTDRGASWQAINGGLNTTCIHGIAVNPTTGTLHALGAARYWRRPAGSTDWEEGDISIVDPTYGRLSIGESERSGIVSDPAGVLYVYGTEIGPFSSVDDGRTWIPRFVDNGPVLDLAVDPNHPGTIFVARGYGGILRSRDGGATWETVLDTGGGAPGSVTGVGVDSHSQRVFALDEHALFASSDGGGSWHQIGSGQPDTWHLLVAPTDGPTLLAVKPIGGLALSRDHGRHWHAASVPGSNASERFTFPATVDPDDPRTLYTAGRFLFRSDDAGTNWRRLGASLLSTPFDLKVDADDPNIVYAATCGAGVQAFRQVAEPRASSADSDGCAIGPGSRSAWPLAPAALLALLVLGQRRRAHTAKR